MSSVRIPRGAARTRLLDAAVDIIRTKGLRGTTVDDLCATAGVTKGAFFYHWSSKEEMAIAAADHWSETTGELFARADFHAKDDPAHRVLAYLELRDTLIQGELPAFSCLVGTMAQEVYATNPDVRDACGASILGHAETLEADIEAALAASDTPELPTAASLARHMMVVIQGAFVVAKAANDPDIVHESIDHLRRYLRHLFALRSIAADPPRTSRAPVTRNERGTGTFTGREQPQHGVGRTAAHNGVSVATETLLVQLPPAPSRQ